MTVEDVCTDERCKTLKAALKQLDRADHDLAMLQSQGIDVERFMAKAADTRQDLERLLHAFFPGR